MERENPLSKVVKTRREGSSAHASCPTTGGSLLSIWRMTMSIAKLAKLAAYAKAPRATFALMHPLKAAKYGAVYMLVRGIARRI